WQSQQSRWDRAGYEPNYAKREAGTTGAGDPARSNILGGTRTPEFARPTPHRAPVAARVESKNIAAGERVFHIKFGYGRVTTAEGNKLTVDFETSGEKKVIDSFVDRA